MRNLNVHRALGVLGMAALLGSSAGAQTVASGTGPAAEGAKTVRMLEDLIRFDSSNRPGDTSRVAAYLKARLEPLGAEIDVVTAPNGKATHFIARLRGDGSRRPLLLAAHADVVPVETARWTVDPFAGVEKDGFVYGRGAMDFKGGLAVFARAVMRIAEQKVPLSRDIILLAEADEEQGAYNTSWLAKSHWDKIDAEFALNEGGYVLQDEQGKVRQVNITTADKMTVVLRLRTQGPVGHASRPMPAIETANGRLVTALARLAAQDTPVKLVPQTRAYLAAVARNNPAAAAGVALLLESDDATTRSRGEAQVLQTLASGAPTLHALMHDTLTITLIKSGVAANVIPGEAEATLDARLLPGGTTDELLEQVRRVVADPAVTVELASPYPQDVTRAFYLKRSVLPASGIDTSLYRALESGAKLLWPQAAVVPALFEAGTDATVWREHGIPVYGVYPYPLNDAILRGMHGHDERISVKSLYEGTDWIYRVLVEVAGRQ